MKRRTAILANLVAAAAALDALQDSLTSAYVGLQGRMGPEAQAAYEAVTVARDEAYGERLSELMENAITLVGKMP